MMNKVKTFEDALALYKGDLTDTEYLLGYKGSNSLIKASVAFLKLSIITEVLNEGWTPDYNSSESKCYPWFSLKDGGISLCDCSGVDGTSCGVTPRLNFKSAQLAVYCGNQFIGLYRDLFVITKENLNTLDDIEDYSNLPYNQLPKSRDVSSLPLVEQDLLSIRSEIQEIKSTIKDLSEVVSYFDRGYGDLHISIQSIGDEIKLLKNTKQF